MDDTLMAITVFVTILFCAFVLYCVVVIPIALLIKAINAAFFAPSRDVGRGAAKGAMAGGLLMSSLLKPHRKKRR